MPFFLLGAEGLREVMRRKLAVLEFDNLDRRAGDFRKESVELYRDGWRLAYMSEYTSSKKAKFSLLACFERQRN